MTKLGFFGAPPLPCLSLGCQPLRRGSFTPPPAVSDVRLARKIPSVFNLDSHFHPPSLSPPRAPPLPAPSAGVCASAASVTLFFSPLFFPFFFFPSKNVCGLLCPPHPPLLPGTCSSAALSTLGPAKSLSALSPATVTGSENSQMTEDFQPRAFGKKKENKRQIIFLDEKK